MKIVGPYFYYARLCSVADLAAEVTWKDAGNYIVPFARCARVPLARQTRQTERQRRERGRERRREREPI